MSVYLHSCQFRFSWCFLPADTQLAFLQQPRLATGEQPRSAGLRQTSGPLISQPMKAPITTIKTWWQNCPSFGSHTSQSCRPCCGPNRLQEGRENKHFVGPAKKPKALLPPPPHGMALCMYGVSIVSVTAPTSPSPANVKKRAWARQSPPPHESHFRLGFCPLVLQRGRLGGGGLPSPEKPGPTAIVSGSARECVQNENCSNSLGNAVPRLAPGSKGPGEEKLRVVKMARVMESSALFLYLPLPRAGGGILLPRTSLSQSEPGGGERFQRMLRSIVLIFVPVILLSLHLSSGNLGLSHGLAF